MTKHKTAARKQKISYVELENVTKTYQVPGRQDDFVVIDDLSLKIEQSEVVIISGESGSGKTTLLNLLGGLDKADSGSIRVDDVVVSDLKEQNLFNYRQRKLGFIFQSHHLLRDFTALENTMLPALISGRNAGWNTGGRINKQDVEEQAVELLERVGLDDHLYSYPYQLSGGECQRVAITRALMNDPTLILADEPTGNLDERRSREVETILFDLLRERGRTMVIVTHDMRLAELGDRHFHLSQGKLRLEQFK